LVFPTIDANMNLWRKDVHDILELQVPRSIELPLAPRIPIGKSKAHKELKDYMLKMKEIELLYYDHIRKCSDCRCISGLDNEIVERP
jgi:hypothetical protein